jgi:hypothetical protein
VETPGRYAELRAWLASEWRKEPAAREAAAVAVFAELGLGEGEAPRWRPLVESETFLALLAERPLAAAA